MGKYLAKKSISSNKGSAAILLVLLVAVLAALPLTFQIASGSRSDTRRHLNMAVQADNIARSGLDETLAWFRRQKNQPVRTWESGAFALYKDASGTDTPYAYVDEAFMPVGNDTLSADIGLVRQYPLSRESGLWARFEVRRAKDGLSVDPTAARDLSQKYGLGEMGSGLCWSVESLGIVFKPTRSVSETVYYDLTEDESEVVARSRAYTEFRSLSFEMPKAALVVQDASDTGLYVQGSYIVGIELVSDGNALAYYRPPDPGDDFTIFFSSGAGSVDVDGNADDQNLSVQSVFGVTLSALKGVADVYLRGDALYTDIKKYPDYGLIVIDGNPVFDQNHPFPRNGIVVVTGNMEKKGNVDASFTGALYVAGNAYIQGPGLLSGVTAVQGKAELRDDFGRLQLWQDPQALTFASRKMSQYRMDRSINFVKRASS